MKPHLVIRLRPEAPAVDAPHWSAILTDKAGVSERLEPAVDQLLDRYHIPVWVTQEYAPSGHGVGNRPSAIPGAPAPALPWSAAEREVGLNRVYRLILQRGGRIPQSLIEEIRLVPTVEHAHGGRVAGVELPTTVPVQMGRAPGEDSREAIGLTQAHRYSEGDPEITIAVLDTGIAYRHPELVDAMAPGMDFVDIIDGAAEFLGDSIDADEDPDDEVGHGTHVAGIIAGRGLRMPVGVAPHCRVLPVRVLAAFRQGERRVGAGLVENINAGVKYAVDRGATVINMSLGVRHAGGGLPHEEVVQYARRRGATIVAASGNDGQEQLYYPGALPGVVAVGAAGHNGAVAPFSTWGRQVSFLAPGEAVYSSYLEDGYASSSGTSHAAPFVAGAFALLQAYARGRGRPLSDGQAKHVLKHTADRPGREFKDRKAGYGRLNLGDAMRLLEAKLN